MYPAKPGLLIGFHGCEESIRNAVVSGETMLKASRNKYDWLGGGFYFWEGNYSRALDFASHPPGRKEIKKPAVLGAVMELQYCLDLMDAEYIRMVSNSYYTLQASANLANVNLPINKKTGATEDVLLRELDCFVIENLHKERRMNHTKAFDSVRGIFVEGLPLYEGAGFR